jgi:cysteine desulfurase
MKNSRIYLDYAATTPLDPRVVDVIQKTQAEIFGNPNSIHREGQVARAKIDEARRSVAEIFNRQEQDVVFTPSATVANNLVLQGVVKRFKKLYPDIIPEIIISPLEHASVYETARAMEREGIIKLHTLSIDTNGQISIDELRKEISQKTALVSVQWVNNETGIIQSIQEIAEVIKENRTKNQTPYPFLHTDAVQGIGHLPITDIANTDYATLSAHKIYGPKGIGVLLLPQDPLLDPIIYGGGQENGWWAGTEPTERIVGCATALAYAHHEQKKNYETLSKIRAYTIQKLHQCDTYERIIIREWKLISPHILSIQLFGITRPDIALDMRGIAVSSGAACSQQSVAPSRVLQMLGLSATEAQESVRISFGKQTTKKEIDDFVKCVDTIFKI